MAYQETIHQKEGFDTFVSTAQRWTRLRKGRLPGGNTSIVNSGFQGAVNFDVTGKAGGQFHVLVDGPLVRVGAGPHASPTGTVTLADEFFMRLLSGVGSWATIHANGQAQISGSEDVPKLASALFSQLKNARAGSGPTAWLTRWWIARVIRKSGVVREAH